MNTRLLVNAIQLHKLGYIPEFGYQDGKRPLRKGWTTKPLNTLEEIYDVFLNTDPVTVGINTHPDGAANPLVVVDNDSPEATARHEARVAAGEWPQTPFVVNTPSGGTHYYYRQDPNGGVWKTSADTVNKLDYRAYHGFVVAPPSIRKDGGKYTTQHPIPPIWKLAYAPKPDGAHTYNIRIPGNVAPIPNDIPDIRKSFTYDGGNYLCPAHTDTHGSLSIRYMQDGGWALKCFTGCTTEQILAAARLSRRDLYPHSITSIEQKVEDTFGPNPCKRIKLVNKATGETMRMLCNTKRCIHCGPRKQALIQFQLYELGEYAYISSGENIEDINRCLEKIKKRARAAGVEYIYQIVGDDSLGYILVSDVKITEQQTLNKLDSWMRRILDRYHDAGRRIRRSRALGRVSLIRLYRKSKSGNPSPWYIETMDTIAALEVEDLDWDELMVLIGGIKTTYAYPPPDMNLPDPY